MFILIGIYFVAKHLGSAIILRNAAMTSVGNLNKSKNRIVIVYSKVFQYLCDTRFVAENNRLLFERFGCKYGYYMTLAFSKI